MRALVELAEAMTRRPESSGPEEIERVRVHAWDDAAVHDALQVIAYFNYINRIAEGVGVPDEPDWA